MPKALHDKLARQARKQGLTGERRNAYVYGTLQKVDDAQKRKAQHTDDHQ